MPTPINIRTGAELAATLERLGHAEVVALEDGTVALRSGAWRGTIDGRGEFQRLSEDAAAHIFKVFDGSGS